MAPRLSDEDLLAQLRLPEAAAAPRRELPRPRRSKGFVQLPHATAAAGYRALGCPQAMVWNFIHYRAWAEGTRTMVVANQALAALGISRKVKYRALAKLEQAGLVRVERRAKRSPLVTLL